MKEKHENFFCKKDQKIAYDKKGAISAKNLRYKKDRVELRIYPCQNHWHLTKRNATKKENGNNKNKKIY